MVLYVPTLTYNLYDGFSEGCLHNKTILDKPLPLTLIQPIQQMQNHFQDPVLLLSIKIIETPRLYNALFTFSYFHYARCLI
jgi:hypothetical protein